MPEIMRRSFPQTPLFWPAFLTPSHLEDLVITTNDTDGIGGPQIGDQPALLLEAHRQCKGPFDGQHVQRRRPAALFACAGEGTV
jgi:hypothetical protein